MSSWWQSWAWFRPGGVTRCNSFTLIHPDLQAPQPAHATHTLSTRRTHRMRVCLGATAPSTAPSRWTAVQPPRGLNSTTLPAEACRCRRPCLHDSGGENARATLAGMPRHPHRASLMLLRVLCRCVCLVLCVLCVCVPCVCAANVCLCVCVSCPVCCLCACCCLCVLTLRRRRWTTRPARR